LGFAPIWGDTTDEALDRVRRRKIKDRADVELALANHSSITMVDFAGLPLDEPLPADLKTNGHQSILDSMIRSGRTPRELAIGAIMVDPEATGLAGTADDVAARMGEIMEEVGGDGFLIMGWPGLTRRYIAEITDGLAPALQRRGLIRTGYSHDKFRENLFEF
jgi:alkanesulfonate monooxygenase SsuD/methylene tetrahydromethanopterin reductase-like flavin-dependent oxidoreductase (luciferase family)